MMNNSDFMLAQALMMVRAGKTVGFITWGAEGYLQASKRALASEGFKVNLKGLQVTNLRRIDRGVLLAIDARGLPAELDRYKGVNFDLIMIDPVTVRDIDREVLRTLLSRVRIK